MPDNQQFVTLDSLGDNFDVGVSEIQVDAATIDVTAATNITATELIAALSEIGSRLDTLEP